MRRRVILILAVVSALAASPAGAQREWREPVRAEDVQRFLDPTVMISRLEYRFQANHLPQDLDVYVHELRPWFALGERTAVWAKIPYAQVSIPNLPNQHGLADLTFGAGRMLHENLARRFTASAISVELTTPSGDTDRGTSLESWIGHLRLAMVANPTDLFSLWVIGTYNHSLDPTVAGEDIRNFQLELRGFRVIPKGLFVVLSPIWIYDSEQGEHDFSLVLGGGKAITRYLAFQATWVEQLEGDRIFDHRFDLVVSWLWGDRIGG